MSLSGLPQTRPDRDTRGFFELDRAAGLAGRVPGAE